MIIYLDMDGVLADFDKQYEIQFGERPKDIIKRSFHFYKNWELFIKDQGFTKLDWFLGAKALLKEVERLKVPVEILSSSGGEKHHDEVSSQKKSWLNAHNILYKANIVPGGSKKAVFAKNKWSVLIDDTPKVVENFRKAGGTAILHNDLSHTICELKVIHSEWLNTHNSVQK